MTYSLHPGAEQDIADALDFYAEQAGTVVAARFLAEFGISIGTPVMMVAGNRCSPSAGGCGWRVGGEYPAPGPSFHPPGVPAWLKLAKTASARP